MTEHDVVAGIVSGGNGRRDELAAMTPHERRAYYCGRPLPPFVSDAQHAAELARAMRSTPAEVRRQLDELNRQAARKPRKPTRDASTKGAPKRVSTSRASRRAHRTARGQASSSSDGPEPPPLSPRLRHAARCLAELILADLERRPSGAS